MAQRMQLTISGELADAEMLWLLFTIVQLAIVGEESEEIATPSFELLLIMQFTISGDDSEQEIPLFKLPVNTQLLIACATFF